MRTGPEQFVAKGFAFYDAMVTPALGAHAVAVYEILRRFVWRDENSGTDGQRYGLRNGHLSARVSRRVIAEYTGLSVRSVQRALRTLRDVGWIIDLDENSPYEGPITFQLGQRVGGRGMEHFFADDYLRDLWDSLEMLAQEEGKRGVLGLTRERRLAFTQEWFADPRQPWHTPGQRVLPPRPESPTPQARGALVNREPTVPKKEEEKSEERLSASPSAPLSAAHSSGRTLKSARDEGEGNPRRKSSAKKDPEKVAKPKTFAEEGETKRAAPKTFADVELEPGEFEDEPVVKTPTRPAEERLGAAQGHIEEAVAKAQAARAARYEKSRSKEQKAQNLRGDGTSRWPTEVRQHLKPLRRTWEEVKGETGLTIDPWDGKAVGQICKLVDMYSGQEVDAALRYVVGNWNTIKERYKFTGVPTVGVVLACHASLVVEAQEWVKHRSVMEEWARWNEANPDELYPPSELKERYRKAREELSAIGLGG